MIPFFLLVSLQVAHCYAAPSVSYDARSLILNGERAFTLSGSIHYQRVLPADWPRVLQLAVEMGLNSVQTYVLWDEHEAAEGAVSFSGGNNLTAFTALAGSLGLRVHVRIGPYICGEHFNGGIPTWMRARAACFRCADPGWEAFSKRVLGLVVGQLTAAGQLWTQGGPVFMLQVENEYSGPDAQYLTDMVMAARALTTDVPWVLCHDLELCSKINAAPGAPPGGFALCTINGFWMEQAAPFVDQPSPSWVALQRASNPRQPMGWTEDQGAGQQLALGGARCIHPPAHTHTAPRTQTPSRLVRSVGRGSARARCQRHPLRHRAQHCVRLFPPQLLHAHGRLQFWLLRGGRRHHRVRAGHRH